MNVSPGLFSAADRYDIVMRQSHARVESRDRFVVPGADLSGVNSGERRAVELHIRRVEARQIIVDRLGGDRHRHVDDLRVTAGVGVGHVGVGRADLGRAGNRLINARARAGGGGADCDAGMRLCVFGRPDVEQRENQCRSCLDQGYRLGARRPDGDCEQRNCESGGEPACARRPRGILAISHAFRSFIKADVRRVLLRALAGERQQGRLSPLTPSGQRCRG